VPLPVRSRSKRAASTPATPFMPASRSQMGTPTFCGSSGPEAVRDINPDSPCAIWSYPPRVACGPSCPNPLIDSSTRPGLSLNSSLVPNAILASTPARKFSIRTPPRRTKEARTAVPSSDFRSRTIDSLLRFADRKYVDSAGCRRRGPQTAGPTPGCRRRRLLSP